MIRDRRCELKVVAIVPARGGSKEVPKKNIRLLGKKPLLAYAIEPALDSKFVDRVIVSTDDARIASIARRYGAEVPFIRPKALAEDDTPDLPVFQHAIKYLEEEEKFFPDIIVHLRATVPFKTGADVDMVIKKLVDTKADGVRTVNLVRENPYWMNMVLKGDVLKPFIDDGKEYRRRQELPPVYRRNGLIDAVRRDVIMKEKSMFAEGNQRAVITDVLRGFEVDSELDFFIIEQLLRKGYLRKWGIG